MKRKKWTEEEEETLIHSYSILMSSSTNNNNNVLLLPSSRQKRLQPIADSVNSLHHLLRPHSFPHLWSWRDVSVKIHNMRHQYLHVKEKLSDSDPFDLDGALFLWPNFLRYRQVFGDADLKKSRSSTDRHGEEDEEEEDYEEEEEGVVRAKRKRKRWRRAEERREVEEMEWMERLLVMQMDHEKQAMQMYADACQAQLQILGVLVRILCQFVGGGRVPGQAAAVAENLQQQQRGAQEETAAAENLQQQQKGAQEETAAESLVGDEHGM